MLAAGFDRCKFSRMRKFFHFAVLFLAALAQLPGASSANTPRNLFHELLGKTEAETDARIEAARKLYFEGDKETERPYFTDSPDTAYTADVGNGDVRSEGMSYGMMMAVQINRREEFDRLWKWARTHMYHETGSQKGWFMPRHSCI